MVKLLVNEKALLAKNSLMLLFSFLALCLANALVILLANLFFPTHIVLGTMSLTPVWALALSVSKLSLLGAALIPLVYYYEWKKNRNLSDKEWMTLYFISNTIFVWVVTRFADIYGLGVSSWLVVVALALVLDIVQGIIMMQLGKIKIS